MYIIQFWRRQEFRFSIMDENFGSVEEAHQQVTALVREMMADDEEDWTGCRFEVTTARGESLLSIPVLPAMSAIARYPGADPTWKPKGFLQRQVHSFRITPMML